MPRGPLNRAAPPIPSVDPGDPASPAIVVTVPPTIWRMVWLLVSATYSMLAPDRSTAMAAGLLNRALLRVPSAVPGDPARPVIVLTRELKSGVICLIV